MLLVCAIKLITAAFRYPHKYPQGLFAPLASAVFFGKNSASQAGAWGWFVFSNFNVNRMTLAQSDVDFRLDIDEEMEEGEEMEDDEKEVMDDEEDFG